MQGMKLMKVHKSKHTSTVVMAATVTAGLFLLMQYLIEAEGDGLNEPPKGQVVEFVRVIDDVVIVEPPKPFEPPPPPEMPPPTRVQPLAEKRGFGVEFGTPPLDPAPRIRPAVFGVTDGNLLPIAKVAPNYPQSARRRNIEGYVLVEFTVDELGRVVDPKVIEAEPVGVFDRSAVEAVRRFKYRPKVLNGQPLPVSGVKHRLSFKLAS